MKNKINIIDVYKEGFGILVNNLPFFLIALIPVIAQIFVGGLSNSILQSVNGIVLGSVVSMDIMGALLVALPGIIASLLITGVVTLIAVSFAEAAYLIATKQVLGKKKVDIKEVLNSAVSKIWSIIAISLICGVAVGVGFLLLVIPGFILMLLLAYAVPIAVLENKSIIDSIKESIAIGKKNMGDTFLFALIAIIVIAVFNAVTGWIPSPAPQMLSALVLTPLLSISFGVFYLKRIAK